MRWILTRSAHVRDGATPEPACGKAADFVRGLFTEYPDLETAFRVLGKIATLELFETQTFPAEDVKLFWKTLV
jgi:hypothetical protein